MDVPGQQYSTRNAQNGQHFLGGLPQKMTVSGQQAAGDIMDAVHKRAAGGEIVLHILQPEICEAPGIVPILPEHIPG